MSEIVHDFANCFLMYSSASACCLTSFLGSGMGWPKNHTDPSKGGNGSFATNNHSFNSSREIRPTAEIKRWKICLAGAD